MTTALERGEGSASRPGRSLPPGNTRYPLYRRLGGPQGRSGPVRKISLPPGFDPRTVQPVASRYTVYATRPTHLYVKLVIIVTSGHCPQENWIERGYLARWKPVAWKTGCPHLLLWNYYGLYCQISCCHPVYCRLAQEWNPLRRERSTIVQYKPKNCTFVKLLAPEFYI